MPSSPRPVVILHGWSDSSPSFVNLGNAIKARLGTQVTFISLADYLTLDDTVLYDDLVSAMDRAWTARQLPRTAGSVDVVVHSTGALVYRAWSHHYFVAGANPAKHLVMLAPANFGSPIAHKGSAFLGRVIKGWNATKWLNVGQILLQGLELGSPYTWNLAFKDLLTSQNFYGPGRVLCTVLVGNTGYQGISAAANENGSDGTVRVSTANLNCAYLKIDFTNPNGPTSEYLTSSNNPTAFGIMDGENHGTITGKDPNTPSANTLDCLIQGLAVEDAGWDGWVKKLAAANEALRAKYLAPYDAYRVGYQNTVTHVTDQYSNDVTDYFMEFYQDSNDWFEKLFHQDMLETTHAYGPNNSYRSLLVNCDLMRQSMAKNPQMFAEGIKISLTAHPDIASNRTVGFDTYTAQKDNEIKVPELSIPYYFVPDRTLLVDIKLPRKQDPGVFKFS